MGITKSFGQFLKEGMMLREISNEMKAGESNKRNTLSNRLGMENGGWRKYED
jgi:hypothetical protein